VFSLYWWKKLYWQVKDHCQNCEDCQQCNKVLHSDTIFSIFMSALFKKMIIDVIKLLMCWDKCYIVVIHKDLSDWVETQALAQATSSTVTCFLWKNIITQHRLFNKLICDDESENKMWIKDLTDLYRIDCIIVSAYNSETNSMMKCEHKFLIDELERWQTKILKINESTISDTLSWSNHYLQKHQQDLIWTFLWMFMCSINWSTYINLKHHCLT
jgi:hypothetical protein